eukprot:TRINITY_DN15302_c0_g1_i1.p1 TRINITY_DN15302_c0_g1~~TRINITY_DN15302_c0_g1_i1.p1  ORF type:complete len:181 (-),score=32.29 TRINITY_DN15302_c0_g1_i1:50-592(-)
MNRISMFLFIFIIFYCANGQISQYFGESQLIVYNTTKWGSSQTILSFGGYSYQSHKNINGVNVYPGFNNDLRRFSNGNWIIETYNSTQVPSSRAFHSFNYNPITEEIYLYGGTDQVRYITNHDEGFFLSCGRSDVWVLDTKTMVWNEIVKHSGECENNGSPIKISYLILSISFIMFIYFS